MSKGNTAMPVLDGRHADFITHHVSINVASCNADKVPSLARALGCRVSPDRRSVTLYLSAPRATAVVLAGQLALAIELLSLAAEHHEEPGASTPPVTVRGAAVNIRHFAADHCVFIDNDYLIKRCGRCDSLETPARLHKQRAQRVH